MISTTVDFKDKKIQLSTYSENIVRIRVGKSFNPTYFERYGVWKEAEQVGETIPNGVKTGNLTASVTADGVVTVKSDRFERSFDFNQREIDSVKKYFNETLCELRPERKQIIGDEEEWKQTHRDFTLDPKYVTFRTENERFYGLGESNVDKLILNGKTYLMRVVYQDYEIPIPFLMTKAGYGILCASTYWHGIDVCNKNKNEICWYFPDGEIDFFVYAGDSLAEIEERYTYMTGRPILLPKWAYGLCFVEQDKANQFNVMDDAAKFRELNIPCDMISLEPGWMSKRYDFSTEKKWNVERFYICDWMSKPHRSGFLATLQRFGFKTQLWLCCKHDFTANEERKIGNDVAPEIPGWYEHLVNFRKDGAASFKVDPCHVVDAVDEKRVYANGREEPEMHNLMQTLLVKEMYQGGANYNNMRPMHHYCGGYTSAGAYSAFTTGDSGGRLKTLAWILNCGLSGIPTITCDMDIFAKHTIHYCFFTAWIQLNSWSGFCHPWWVGEDLQNTFVFYDKLRYRLLPYIYSSAIQTSMTGMPECRAMPFVYEDEEVQDSVYEYMFGDNMLVGAFSDKIYLPRGSKWINYWTKEVFEGGQYLDVNTQFSNLQGGVLFVKEGAIIPTEEPQMYTDCKDHNDLILEVYPGNSSYTFYEDDGVSLEYKNGKRAETLFSVCKEDKTTKVVIGERKGSFEGMSDGREYRLDVFSEKKPLSVEVNGKKTEFSYEDKFVIINGVKSGEVVVNY